MMTELEKYQAVNKCESFEELANVIESFADEDGMIQGRADKHDAERMARYCRNFSMFQPYVLTREYGIRQQALYISYYQSGIRVRNY
jgi:RAB protein geranylgeranyltransferase component A